MKSSKSIVGVVIALSLVVLLAGCGPKAAGTWNLPDQGNGAGTITLSKDGTGTMNVPPSPSAQIKWSEDGNSLKIFQSTDDPSTATPLMTGTLSDDNKQLTLAIGSGSFAVSQTFTRQ